MNPHYTEQKDEIDLLQNIIPDKLKIVSDSPTFVLEITIEGNVDEPRMEFILNVDLGESYPPSPPSFTLSEENNFLGTSKLKALTNKLTEMCNDYAGMPVIYQLYEAVQSFADEEETNLVNEKLEKIKLEEEQKILEEKKKEEEAELLENKTYTPVTKELFDEWYKAFVKKNHDLKGKKVNDGRISGREFFMNKNIKLDENEEEIEVEKEDINKITAEKEEENFNPELYEEDIDDIDFDNDDIDNI